MDLIYQFLVSCIPAAITGFVAYSKSNKSYQVKIKELEQRLTEDQQKHEHEIEIIKLQFENKRSGNEQNLQNEFVSKVVSGEVDLSGLSQTLETLGTVSKQLEKFKK